MYKSIYAEKLPRINIFIVMKYDVLLPLKYIKMYRLSTNKSLLKIIQKLDIRDILTYLRGVAYDISSI